MNCRRMIHWYGTPAAAARRAVARKGAGIAKRSAATGVFTVMSLSFTSITVRPFSSYLRDAAMRVVPTVCQSASTRSQVTSPQMLS